MSERENGMPKPEAYWIALGIFIAAVAIALGRRRRVVLFGAMRSITAMHDTRSRIFGLWARNNGRSLALAVSGAVTWITRLLDELDEGGGL